MRKAKRIFSALLCATLLTATFAGCEPLDLSIDPSTDTSVTEPIKGIDAIGYTIPYLRTDSLNPFVCETETNRNIAMLIFDPLFNVNNDFSTEPVIAESYTLSGRKLSVKIKTNLTFSDGSVLTSQDIVYSFTLAKNSKFYSPLLNNFSTAGADGNGNVVFTLKQVDPNAVANLTFPIIKKDSDKNNNSDGNLSFPIGSGRYSIVQEKDSRKLVVNKERLGSYHPQYNQIGLKDITETSSITTLFDLNQIDFYTENFSEGSFKRYTGASTKFDTTNFVYLGVNSQSNKLKDSMVRRAISLLVDRSNISTVAFSDFAQPTATPFHPAYHALKGCSVMPVKFNDDAAIDLLERAGFDKVSDYGIRYSAYTGKLELRLIVNKENSFKLAMARNIQQTLAKADIIVVIKEYSYKNYVNAVKEGAYDLYIGEVMLPNSFYLNGFFTENGGYSFGIDPACKSATDYNLFLEGKKTMQEFLDTFTDELPFIPVLYRQGITVKGPRILTESKTIISDYFYNVNDWTVE
ncbi:MAG: hypothetical protein J6A67_05510 [Clostridia bacterium]|nr:hypothetical protein [Clostridia bacterium]